MRQLGAARFPVEGRWFGLSLSLSLSLSPGKRWRWWHAMFGEREKHWTFECGETVTRRGRTRGWLAMLRLWQPYRLLPKQSKYQLDLEINNHMRCLEGRRRIFGLIGGILEWLGGRVLEGLAKRGCACGSVQGTSAKLQEDHYIHAQRVVYATTWDFPGVG